MSEIKEGAGKELPKLERVLLSVKDRHVKLEEKEKSEREKFKSKVDPSPLLLAVCLLHVCFIVAVSVVCARASARPTLLR